MDLDKTSIGHSEDQISSDSERFTFAVLAEVEEKFDSYEDAAKAAVNYIIYNKTKPTRQDKALPIKLKYGMHLYPSKANKPEGIEGKIVGIGIKKNADSKPIDLIRIDYDPKKGFHFNVVGLSHDRTWRDDDKKLAAKFPDTAPDKDKELLKLVEPLQHKDMTADHLWNAWKDGKRP